MIRQAYPEDFPFLADLWLETSYVAHDFIVQNYWLTHQSDLLEIYLPQSEVYVATNQGTIQGFVALNQNYLAALFVDLKSQNQGIGTSLLDFAKSLRSQLKLNVYQKNEKSVHFYKKNGFQIIGESIDEGTGELEFIMEYTIQN